MKNTRAMYLLSAFIAAVISVSSLSCSSHKESVGLVGDSTIPVDPTDHSSALTALLNEDFVFEASRLVTVQREEPTNPLRPADPWREPSKAKLKFVNQKISNLIPGNNFIVISGGECQIQVASKFNRYDMGSGSQRWKGKTSKMDIRKDRNGNYILSANMTPASFTSSVTITLFHDSDKATAVLGDGGSLTDQVYLEGRIVCAADAKINDISTAFGDAI